MIPASFLVVAVLDALPVPTDAGYFYVQKWLDDHRDDLSDRAFWFYTLVNYYGWDVAWYLSGFAVTYFFGKTLTQKALIAVGLISGGAIVAELVRFSGTTRQRHGNPVQPRPTRLSLRASAAGRS